MLLFARGLLVGGHGLLEQTGFPATVLAQFVGALRHQKERGGGGGAASAITASSLLPLQTLPRLFGFARAVITQCLQIHGLRVFRVRGDAAFRQPRGVFQLKDGQVLLDERQVGAAGRSGSV